MAPNNALAERRKAETQKNQGSTTVLAAGTVEARGTGSSSSSHVIEAEIQQFLDGQGKLSAYAETRAFFTVWTFLTRLPGPTWTDHHPGFLMRGAAYFPLAGFLIGMFVSVFADFAHVVLGLPLIVSVLMSTAASFWVTGCFHEDGLADASDGIGGGWSRNQILTIMTDTRLGTYGCAVLLFYVMAKVHLLASQGPSSWGGMVGTSHGVGPALLVTHAAARSVAPYMIRTRDYVDETGPKYKFYKFMVHAKHLVSWHRVGFAVGTTVLLGFILYGPVVTLFLFLSLWCLAHASGAYGEYLLGGVMGDFLGATICVAELTCLTVLRVSTSLNHPGIETFMGTLKDFTSSASWGNFSDPSHPLGVLARFVLVITLTVLWSRNVGHPSVVVRETVAKAQDKASDESDDGEVRVAFQEESQSTPESKTSASLKVKEALSLSGSTFSDRYEAARSYLDGLAKPMGSLGTLEDWAAKVAALQGTTKIQVDPVACLIFAADHGAAKSVEDGGSACSAYPQAVTQSIIKGLEMGIAGASAISKANSVRLFVVDVGVCGATYNGPIVQSAKSKLVGGTRNICVEPAMTVEETKQCLKSGRLELANVVAKGQAKVVVLGEVGIGNTTASSALAALLTSAKVDKLCGGGATTSRTVTKESVKKKIQLVRRAVEMHSTSWLSKKLTALDALTLVGGAEIAALVGAFLECSDRQIPVLCDGFIVSTAAMVAVMMEPKVCRVILLSSTSTEPGYQVVVEKIMEISKVNNIPMSPPALSMGLRMGEATAGLVAVPLLRSAAAMIKEMGTIEDILTEGPK